MIAIWGLFCGPEWFIGGSCVGYGSLLVWKWPFPGYGGGGGGGLWFVSKVEGLAREHLAFRGLSCREALVTFYHFTCGFDFGHGLWLPFLAAFALLRGLLMVPVGSMGPFWPGDRPFQAVGELLGYVQNRELSPRASPSKVFPAGKLQWHFTCGFNFRHSLWLPFVAAFAALKGLLIFIIHIFNKINIIFK